MSKDLTDAQMLEALVPEAYEKSGGKYAPWWMHHRVDPDLDGYIEDGLYYWAYNKGAFVGQPIEDDVPVYSIIFNHDFARALFGNAGMVLIETGEWITKKENDNHRNQWVIGSLSCFQYHLQQAVISNNPIKYMYEAVFNA